MRGRSVRNVVVLGLIAALVVVVVIAVSGGSKPTHKLWVTIPDATGMLTGEPIRDAGVTVGNVSYLDTIDGGRAARVGLSIDSDAWPIQRGSIFHLRWGGTISYVNDYVDLLRPAHGGADYASGATLPGRAFTVTVQFDTLIDDFTPGVRAGLQSALVNGGAALGNAESGLAGTIEHSPPALSQANAVMSDLNGSSAQLKSTINSAADVVNAFQSAQPTVEDLISGAGQTLTAVGDRASALDQTLSLAPPTFVQIDATLARADTTLDLAQRVTGQIGPGVTQLRQTVTPLNRLLERVEDVAPNAKATLVTLTNHAPQITDVVNELNSLMPSINYTATHANPELGCIRPYTPDIVSLTTNWARFISSTDGTDFYARILPGEIVPAASTVQSETPAQAEASDPGLTSQFPEAPGAAADQPWYQPQCGITASDSNPDDDPEVGSTDDTPVAVTDHPGNSR